MRRTARISALTAGAGVLACGATAAVAAGFSGGGHGTEVSAVAGRTVLASSPSDLQKKVDAARPGDTVLLRDGTYALAKPVAITGRAGTKQARITVGAQHTGKVVLTGTAGITLSRSPNVTVAGFVFHTREAPGVPADSPGVRFTRNTFRLAEPASKNNWVSVEADDVRIDRNTFAHKRSQGVFLQINGPGKTMAQRTRVSANLFTDHGFGGSNGGECIRLGYGDKGAVPAHAVIEGNLLDRANGDVEGISVKSSNNVVRYNTIRSSKGWIVLRFSNDSQVYGNDLFGTSGIRFYGRGHDIHTNYVEGGVTVGGGTSDPNAYWPADHVRFTHNTVLGQVTSDHSGGGKAHDLAFADNIVRAAKAPAVKLNVVKSSFAGNLFFAPATGAPGVPGSGYRFADPKLKLSGGLQHLVKGSPAVNAAKSAFPGTGTDIDGQPATGTADIGADELSALPVARVPLTSANVGPSAS
ncbi:polysaccharide lyase 6 family protein [Actinomadura oligospora]|uniref:polysaccharide lyase 6 family protein n=1 Tax=Actinomadura oligospora TaxID=111804 RepID=UPI0004B7D185|nr:polysaccharide lyase 6 family protein [Actinomadura oligospora]